MHCGMSKTATSSNPNRPVPTETMPRPGHVTEVCKEWLVHEDNALAYRLQNEEIQHHYTGNKFRNAQVRQDIPCAKDVQKQEEEEAANVKALYDQMIREQEEVDERVARELAEKIEREEREKRNILERRDKQIAHHYQSREKPRRKMQEPDERLLVQDMRKMSVNNSNEAGASCIIRSSDPLSDLSDFCLPPDPNMSEEEARVFQEEQDAELARLLQEQEMKRRGDSALERDRLLAVEAQDHEYARMLQEKEKAKIKRARERAKRKKQMQLQEQELQNQQQQHEEIEEEEVHDQIDQVKQKEPLMNIAMAIDPTYTQQSKNSIKSSSSGSCSSSTNPRSIIPEPVTDLDCDDIPPYMPIQGQRRTSSLEKKSKKGKIKKETKDGCKQQ